MIVRVTGRLQRVEGGVAVVSEAGGSVWRAVLVPAVVGESLAGHEGEEVTLHTLEYLESRDQGTTFVPRLVGFVREEERRLFELLTTVKGIGARKALRVMAREAGEIAGAIGRRDVGFLVGLPEVGKRLAETMIAELSGKVGAGWEAGVESKAGVSGVEEEAVRALMALGETRAEAQRRVRRAVGLVGAGGTVEEIVAASLAGSEG